VLSGSLLNQGLERIILKDVDDKFKGTIIILKDEKCNAKAVLGPVSQLRMLDPSEDVLVVDKDNDDIDFDKIIEAQVVNKTLDTFEPVPADAQVALNDALEPIFAFEERLKAGGIFDLNSPIESHPFTKSVFYQWPRGNHARVIKEPSAKSKDVCEVLTLLRLGPALQVMRLLAMAYEEFETLRPYPCARTADGISLLLNVVLWNLFTAQHFKATNDMITRGLLVKMPLKDGLPDSIELEATLDSAGRLLRIQGDPGPPTAALASSYAQKVPS
jgi:hypothetical protein